MISIFLLLAIGFIVSYLKSVIRRIVDFVFALQLAPKTSACKQNIRNVTSSVFYFYQPRMRRGNAFDRICLFVI